MPDGRGRKKGFGQGAIRFKLALFPALAKMRRLREP
jgi:hypothetical protein